MFLRNWIRSGVNKVGDLSFIDGELDVEHTYGLINEKQNIHAEILQVKKALREFRRVLREIDEAQHFQNPASMTGKSKEIYLRYIKMKTDSISIYDVSESD